MTYRFHSLSLFLSFAKIPFVAPFSTQIINERISDLFACMGLIVNTTQAHLNG